MAKIKPQTNPSAGTGKSKNANDEFENEFKIEKAPLPSRGETPELTEWKKRFEATIDRLHAPKSGSREYDGFTFRTSRKGTAEKILKQDKYEGHKYRFTTIGSDRKFTRVSRLA